MIIVVMGVMGAGKSTVGQALAAHLRWRFIDADDFHSAASRARLARGEPLTDADRAPWLAALRTELAACLARGESVVLACSALRQRYRDALEPPSATASDMRFVYLRASVATLASRVGSRIGHMAAPSLLASQLRTLEEPVGALTLDAQQPPDVLVARIIAGLGLRGPQAGR